MRLNSLHIIVVFIIFCSCFKAENLKSIDVSNEALKLTNGVLYFNNNSFTGYIVSYFKDSKLKSETQYKNGRKQGYEREWLNNGTLILDRYYNEGKKVGIHKSWWPNENPKFEYHFNDKGVYHGIVKEWYESGQIFRIFNYHSGKETGSQRLWKPDGSIKANYQVVNNERFGLIGLKKCYQVTVGSEDVIYANTEVSNKQNVIK